MFTGIIQGTGCVQSVRRDSVVTIDVQIPSTEGLEIGASVSIDGVCLTATSVSDTVTFDVIPETLNVTTVDSWVEGELVNIERAVTAGTPLGGHIVQGHIDYVSTITNICNSDGSYVLTGSLTPGMELRIVDKGCITLNGVSLTISSIDADSFSVSLIPETLQMTNLNRLRVGDAVNVETDVMTRSIASIVEKMLASKQQV